MTYVFFWVAAALCLVAQIAILRSVLTAESATRTDGGAPPSARSVELLWVMIPALVLALVLVLTWRAIDHHGAESAQHTVRDTPASTLRSI